MSTFKIESDGVAKWIAMEPSIVDRSAISARCTIDFLSRALGHLGHIEVVSAAINSSGQFGASVPAAMFPIPMPNPLIIDNLPEYCDITIARRGAGKHVTTITIWVPLVWNERFLGTLGGGNRTESVFGMPETMRTLCIQTALRNGFATAKTDGANRSERMVDWGFDEEAGVIDWELTENWIHRSTHEMTVIGKAVTTAIHGRPPRYSYAAGCSGGGRQAIVEAQRYPNDYDGIWACDPAINWNKFCLAGLWPAVVMKDITVLAPAKFEAFRSAAIAACDGIDGLRDGIIGAFDPCNFDARTIVGQNTDAGVITEADAQAMNMIWEGPRRANGDLLWYGIGVGNESWGNNWSGGGLCMVKDVGGQLEPEPFFISTAYAQAWVAKDPKWDWRTLTIASFEDFFDRGVKDMAIAESDNPDLSQFGKKGGKLLITHGGCDQVIPVAGSIDYYRRVIARLGSEDSTRQFARLFVSEGDGHGANRDPGPGITVSEAMTALMKWVEMGEAPDVILARTLDIVSGKTSATRPVFAYPMVPQYRGDGDGCNAESFVGVHYETRAGLAERGH
jgi:hypothetical protein